MIICLFFREFAVLVEFFEPVQIIRTFIKIFAYLTFSLSVSTHAFFRAFYQTVYLINSCNTLRCSHY